MALTKITKAVSEESTSTITATVGASALTVGVSKTFLEFRSATLTDGTVNTCAVPAQTLVVPDTATLGTVNAVQSRLVVIVIDNDGVGELAIVNQAGGNDLSETGIITTVAIDATADTANVFYSTTARTDVAYRVVGFVESTQATAGTWATAPSTIQGAGGQALTAMSSLGYGQTWQDVSGSRISGTTYYNTTGKPIQIMVTVEQSTFGTSTAKTTLVLDGHSILIGGGRDSYPKYYNTTFIVPEGSVYTITNVNMAFTGWLELR